MQADNVVEITTIMVQTLREAPKLRTPKSSTLKKLGTKTEPGAHSLKKEV